LAVNVDEIHGLYSSLGCTYGTDKALDVTNLLYIQFHTSLEMKTMVSQTICWVLIEGSLPKMGAKNCEKLANIF